jgi:uncharacterized membrane protein SirB2
MVRRIGFATLSALLAAQLLQVAVAHHSQSAHEPANHRPARLHWYLPHFWISLLVLLATGLLLIIGEPQRTTHNPVFYTKMMLLLLILSIGVVLLLKRQARGRRRWAGQGQPVHADSRLDILSCLDCNHLCGRWIAYRYNASV